MESGGVPLDLSDYSHPLSHPVTYTILEPRSAPRITTVYPALAPPQFYFDTAPIVPSPLVRPPRKNMDGLVMPQPSAMHESEFNTYSDRCPVPGDSNTTLWQFLLELLRDGGYPHLIQWTNRGGEREGEFKLLNAEGVAQLWGKRKGKEHMNYDKLSRALRYYYDKNIIKKVIGQKFVYRFVGNNSGGHESTPSHPSSNDNLYHPYRPNGGMKLLSQNLPQSLGIDMQNIKKEVPEPMFSFPTIPTSSALPITPQNMNTSDLASLNLSGVSTTSNDTPSPTDSSCSPNSLCSSSGVSSAVPTIASPPGPSSRPSSAHSPGDDRNISRKRKVSPPPPIKVEKEQPAMRRSRPENLDLASTQFLNPTLPMAISPMNVMQQMSPFLLPQQMQLYALAGMASASLCGPNSPLFSGLGNNSPFRSPLSTPKVSSVFQFPPNSTALVNLINSPAMLSAGLNGNSNSIFKFPTADVLKTPTLPMLSQLTTKSVPVNSDS